MKQITVILLLVLSFLAGLTFVTKVKETSLGASQINKLSTASATTTTTVAGKGAVVLLANTARKYAVLTNTTATIAYLTFNATTTPNGTVGIPDSAYTIPLAASGGSYTIDLENLYIGQVLASSSAAVTIRALEVQ